MNLHDLTVMLFALAVLLGTARLAGELVQKIGQPSILGEISAGILLGPTVLGHFRPQWYSALFPATGPVAIVINTVATLGVLFFLLAAGLETSLKRILRQGRNALLVSFFGVVIPFASGLIAAELFPQFIGGTPGSGRHVFALFVATALSISALPVIAKTLMDLRLLDTEFGVVVISSAMMDDLVGWILFGVVMGMVQEKTATGIQATPNHILKTVFLVATFVAFTISIGRSLIVKALCLIKARSHGRGVALAFIVTLTLAAAGLTEYAGIHAIFGAFIMAVAIGDALVSTNDVAATCRTLERGRAEFGRIAPDIRQVVMNVFAPFFFASVGLHTDFAANFSLEVTFFLFGLACLGKVLGATWGARLGGTNMRSSWAIGFAMNSRGAMEIIVATLAVHVGLIGERMFVALVIIALFTSLISGPVIQRLMQPNSENQPERVV